MVVPTSTYRLQFRGDMSFKRAQTLIPHLKDLGISHVYASPIFTAIRGSTHGYDVTDANEIDPDIGGQEGFDRFVAALRCAGLGLILDIVPNHMAASVENPWWRDVLRRGRNSNFAGHFDIDWTHRLTLPLLGKPLDEALQARELELAGSSGNGSLELVYFDHRLPLSEGTVSEVERQTGLKAAQLRALSIDPERMKALLAKQHWQLIHWTDAASKLSYRRFFEVAGLVGVRVEDQRVFDDTHRLVIELVRSGQIQGLRIDHVDGLADPKIYLQRLRRAVGPDIFIVVEKILTRGETLPADWPVSGTTGYEFIAALADLFVSDAGLRAMDAAYRPVSDGQSDHKESLRKAKLLMIKRNFAGELARLSQLASRIFPDLDRDKVSSALAELLAAFPVYRLYGCQGSLSATDDAVLRNAIIQARSKLATQGCLDAIESLLDGSVAGTSAGEFRARFQQLSGPLMAKSVEDTLFYRDNRLIALNEVGGEAADPRGGVEAFHRSMAERRRLQHCGLSSTSTHDTKRGEDARARLYSLTQLPEMWIAGVERWRVQNASFCRHLAQGPAPEPNVEWMLYQALAGIWPEDIEPMDRGDELRHRFRAYVLKAIREAKLRTDWLVENPSYEEAVLAYADALLCPENRAFRTDFERTLRPFVEFGYRNSLAQLLIKLTAPGIPDIYQGTEGLDFSMVDPDNRRPVVEAWSGVAPQQKSAEATMAGLKRDIIRTVLNHRNNHPGLFLEGSYLPLNVRGARSDRLVAYARIWGPEAAITVVPRLVDGQGPDYWQDTEIVMPTLHCGQVSDLFTGKSLPMTAIPAVQLFDARPVAFLIGTR